MRAPIAGRISDRRVDAGNLITGGQTGATLLTSIVTMDPIHFVFDGSEADFIRYLRLAASGVGALLVVHALPLTQGVEGVAFHLRPVEEDVGSVLCLNETEAPVAHELLDRPCGHLCPPRARARRVV